MTIAVGTRLGPYEVVAPIGAGGMGEVWRGRDTRLDRSVAIKIVPPEFAQRFDREAKSISSLNHPNICTLYDVGPNYLVMELLDGESLADRLSKGPLPLEQVLRYGTQIADALNKAHRQGIVHRDLKPGNVMITKAGAKLLDFGLAKDTVVSPVAGSTVQKPLTEEGAIVGTFQYMAPEQLEGLPADARTDIFAFGAVLYEMATGKRAFDGKSKASVIANILGGEPKPISAVQPAAPASLDRVIRTCLQKDPDERWQSAHDIAIELRAVAEGTAQLTAHRRNLIVPALITLLLVTTAVFAYLWRRAASQKPMRFETSILPPENTEFTFSSSPAISPDGSRIAYNALSKNDTRSHLYVRRLDDGTVQELSQSGVTPFWSPDSRSVAFFDSNDRKLKRADAAGGPPQAICEFSGRGVGGTWGRDGVIIFSPGGRHGLYRVPAAGGTAVEVTKLDRLETWHRWPWFLPDGKHFLYVTQTFGGSEIGRLYVASLDSNEKKLLAYTTLPAQYSAADGHLLYCRDRALVAQPFDLKKLELQGEPSVVSDTVFSFGLAGSAAFSVSTNGILAFARGSGERSQLVWRDRTGKQLGVVGEPADYQRPSLAHDGRHVAYEVFGSDGKADIWIYDMARQTASRFTSEPGSETNAIWSDDDRYIVYAGEDPQTGSREIIKRASTGSGAMEKLTAAPGIAALTDWSADGNYIFFHDGLDIFYYSIPDRKIVPVVQTPFNDSAARLSRDGRWLAYTSEQSGHPEVYVQPFPNATFVTKISTNGGTQARWTADGRQLIYETADHRVMSVDIKPGPPFEAGVPKQLFAYSFKPGGWALDMSGDGQRFLVNESVRDTASIPITIVQNFAAKYFAAK